MPLPLHDSSLGCESPPEISWKTGKLPHVKLVVVIAAHVDHQEGVCKLQKLLAICLKVLLQPFACPTPERHTRTCSMMADIAPLTGDSHPANVLGWLPAIFRRLTMVG